jgi:hypothetical protein
MRSGVAAVMLLAGSGAVAQKGVGSRFETRDPYSCGSRKEPAKGGPSPEQAKQYFVCEDEHVVKGGTPENDQLWLDTNVTVEVGRGRPFNIGTDSGCALCTEIDPAQPVYPIRGTYTQWACGSLHPCCTVGVARGANCARAENPVAKGMCFKTTFGDWHCVMSGSGLLDLNRKQSGPMQP